MRGRTKMGENRSSRDPTCTHSTYPNKVSDSESPGNTTSRAGSVEGHLQRARGRDRKSTRLNSSHDQISYAVFCLKKKKTTCRTFGACSASASIARSPSSSRRDSQSPAARRYGTNLTEIDITCRPGGEKVGSTSDG